MELDKIKSLIKMFDDAKLSKLSIEDDGFKISMHKEIKSEIIPQSPIPQLVPRVEEEEEASVTGYVVKAPLVGTFYTSPNPDSSPFVQIGSMVSQDDTVCVIEAMKMINEIKSPVSGKVVNVFKTNGELVGYDEPLFEIEEM